jgi:hypothetical protein
MNFVILDNYAPTLPLKGGKNRCIIRCTRFYHHPLGAFRARLFLHLVELKKAGWKRTSKMQAVRGVALLLDILKED